MRANRKQEAEVRVRGFTTLRTTVAIVAVSGVAMIFPGIATASPNTLYVAGSGGVSSGAAADAGNCQTESTPCATLGYAVSQASSGDTIEISGTVSVSSTVTVTSDLNFANNPDGSAATIQGTGATTQGLLLIIGPQTVAVRGLTLEDGVGSTPYGGAITNPVGNLTVTGSTLTANTTTSGGGAIASADGGIGGSLTVSGSTFSNNSAAHGGAIDAGYDGGADTLNISDSTFDNNSASGNGGAIDENDHGNIGGMTVTESTFTGNTAGADGGAIDGSDDNGVNGPITVSGSTFTGNTAGGNGNTIDNTDNGGSSSPIYVAGDVFNGTCDDSNTSSGSPWQDAGYNAASDSSCLGGSTVGTDATTGSAAGDLASLANYGGSTDTLALTQGSSALGLIPDSTSVTTGPGNTVTLACPATDQRGITSAAGQACDAGATQQTAPTVFAAGTGGDNAAAASNDNDCSDASTPCASLQGALAQVVPTGAVELSGTLDEAQAANVWASATIETNPTDSQPATLDGTAQDSTGLLTVTGTGADITLSRLLFENGNAPTGNVGGAVNHNVGGQLTINDSTFLDNVGQNGGAIDNNDATSGGLLTVTDSSFIGNSAPDGGAIDNNDNNASGGSATISDSTFSANQAADGGAVDNNDNHGTGAQLTITQSTLGGDVAFQLGPEIGNDHYGTGGSVWVGADLFAGACSDFSSRGWTDAGYNAGIDGTCEGPSPAGTDAISQDARHLSPPASNGGDTQTMELNEGNPAIGLIPLGTSLSTGPRGTVAIVCPLGADQRGVASVAGAACDAGAVQYAEQALSFTSTVPSSVEVGQSGITSPASSTSGLPVSYSPDGATTNGACTLNGDLATFVHVGTCVIDASQPGDQNFAPAETISQTAITVGPASTTTALTYASGALSAKVGAVPPGGGTPGGTVEFMTGSQILGTAALSNGTATFTYAAPGNSSVPVTASYQGSNDYMASSSSALSVSGPTVTTTTTTTTTTTPTTTTPTTTAPTTTTTTTTTTTKPRPSPKPTITAKLSSRRARARNGWWTAAVRVSFRCDANGARLRRSCPAPVMLSRSGRGQHVTRTVTTIAGRRASVTISGINIDLSRPRVRIAGPSTRRTYSLQAPAGRCSASDHVSGIRTCKLTSHRKAVSGGYLIRYTALATSMAGISTTRHAVVHVSDIALLGATAEGDGTYAVTPGHAYVLEVLSKTRPAYLHAAPGQLGPTAPSDYFARAGSIAGTPLWKLTIRITPGFAKFPSWTIGVRTAASTRLLRLLV